MALVRVKIRNEYGLGRPELYKGTNTEDPKAVLDGVVVAGLVGILRQLGDLADFAAEVFHGLQEQVLSTASRSRKLTFRVQNIEACLPSLEKAILTQTSHIHFAYTAGCEWHSREKTEQNHFIYSDLPHFIMDSYEECRDPPRLHLLDKYDPGGRGSCLRRYSDPTFFKRVSADSDQAPVEKSERSKKTSRSKKKRLLPRNGETLLCEQMHSNFSSKKQMHSNGGRRTSSSQTADVALPFDLEDHSYSVDSRADVEQRKSLSRRNGETLQVEQMQSNDARQTSSSQTADVELESDLLDHYYFVDPRADVEQRKSLSQRDGKTLLGEQIHRNDSRMQFASHVNGRTSSSQTDMEGHSYSVDSRADVGQRDSFSCRDGETLQGEQMRSNGCRVQSASHVKGQTSSTQTADVVPGSDLEDHSYSFNLMADAGYIECIFQPRSSVILDEQECKDSPSPRLTKKTDALQAGSDVEPGSDLEDHSYSVDVRNDAGYVERVFQPSNPVHFDKQECKESASPRLTQMTDALQSASPTIDYNFSEGSFDEPFASTSMGLTWVEKEEIVDSEIQWCDSDEIQEVLDEMQNPHMHEDEPAALANRDFLYGEERTLKPISSMVQTDETDSEPDSFLDALNTIESESENDLDCETKQEAEQFTSHVSSEVMGNEVGTASTVLDHDFYNVFSHTVYNVSLNGETGLNFPETVQEIPPNFSDRHETSLRNPVQTDVTDIIERTDILVAASESGNSIHEPVPEICKSPVLDCSVGSIPLDDTCSLNDSVQTSIESIPSNVPANVESKGNLVVCDGSESPTHQQEPHRTVNHDLDSSIGAKPLDDTHIIDNAVPIESVQSYIVDRERTESLSDSSEYQIREQVPPHVYGNSGFDNAYNDSLSASSENVRLDGVINSKTAENLADSHAQQSPIHEHWSRVCEDPVSECLVGTSPLSDYPTHNDSVSVSIETDPSDDPVKYERTINLADSQDSMSAIDEQLPHISGNSVLNCLGSNSPLGDDHILHDIKSVSFETDIASGFESSNLQEKEADGIDNDVCQSKETPSEPANDPSVGLWTNGGLLGLEPSKPPHFITSSSLNQGLMTSTDDIDGISNHNLIRKSNGFREEQYLSKIAEPDQKAPSSKCLVSQCDNQSGKTSNSHWKSSSYGQNDEDFDKSKVPPPGNVVQVANAGYTEPIKGSGINSPLLFGLGHKLLMNSFYRKVSYLSGPDNSVKTGLLEQGGQNSIDQQSLSETTFKGQVTCDYPIYSPPPSPPIEHMKISFCPVEEFESFKLKLKFPDVSNHSDNTRDVFPSFWLVPEHSILVHDSGSNSDDDDTFCRSSAFVSDHCLSPRSDYNSDQWDSDDTPDTSSNGVYDSSLRISQDSVEPSLSGNLLDFPCYDTINLVLGKECNNHKLQGHAESISPAPCMSKDNEQIYDPNIAESTLQVRPTLVERNPTDREDHEFYDYIPHKSTDKSFNKKHAVTGKANEITIPTTTDKVAAILEKANAIRQVISSDDGEEDDSWIEI